MNRGRRKCTDMLKSWIQTSYKQTLLYYDNVLKQNVFYEIKCTVVVQGENEIPYNNRFPVKFS